MSPYNNDYTQLTSPYKNDYTQLTSPYNNDYTQLTSPLRNNGCIYLNTCRLPHLEMSPTHITDVKIQKTTNATDVTVQQWLPTPDVSVEHKLHTTNVIVRQKSSELMSRQRQHVKYWRTSGLTVVASVNSRWQQREEHPQQTRSGRRDVSPLELRQVSEVDDAVNNGDTGSQGDENM